jgi:hypothetical protein
MLSDYLELAQANNQERKFYARLVQALSKVTRIDENEVQKKHFLNRPQRIKMGFLLYIMQEIYRTYYLRSAKNSTLYTLACKAMNIDAMTDIDADTRLACLATFETFLFDKDCIAQLEREMGRIYLDPKIHCIRKRLDAYIEAIQPSDHPQNEVISGFAISTAALVAMISAAPSYGTGYVIGYALNQIDNIVDVKMEVAKVTGYSMTVIFGEKGRYLGYYVADMIIEASLERGFAKIFEALGMLVGAATGGIIGIAIGSFSYTTLQGLCSLYKSLHEELKDKLPATSLAKDLDQTLIDCLLALPSDIFPATQKQRICHVTGQTMFNFNRCTDEQDQINLIENEDTPIRVALSSSNRF